MSSHLFTQQTTSSHHALALCLVVMLIISEGLYLVYEAVYIVEEKALYLLTLNGAAALIAGLLLLFSSRWVNMLTVLEAIVCIRLFLFVIMAVGAGKLFDLYPPRPTMSSRLVTKAMVLASLAYVCGTPLALLLAR